MLRLPTAEAARRLWYEAIPFPFVHVPMALHDEDAQAIAAEFPPPTSTDWHVFDGPLERGKCEASASAAGEHVARLHAELASDGFVAWLREVSGIPDLIADPYRVGGGIHQSGPRARLGLHYDFSRLASDPSWVRAVNVLVFVGWMPMWADSWEGHLILGAPKGERGEGQVKIAPLPGTFVAFAAGEGNYHGHPFPMSEDAPLRRSLAAYYFRPETPDDPPAHSTVFLETT